MIKEIKDLYKTLDFDKVLDKVKNLAKGESTKVKLETQVLFKSKEEIEKELRKVFEAKLFLVEFEYPLKKLPNITSLKSKLRVTGSLFSRKEISSILILLKEAIKIKRNIKNFERFDNLKQILENLPDFEYILEFLSSKIDERGFILNSASNKLEFLRNQIKEVEKSIKDLYHNLFSKYPNVFPDRIIKIIDGKYVSLAKPNYAQSLKANLIEKASFNVYIEPKSIEPLNIKLKNLILEEEKEEEKILKEISNFLTKTGDKIWQVFKILETLDFYMAKGLFALLTNSNLQKISNKWNIKKARHPLIENPVPIDLKLEKGLIITGPNTGGKTAALKTFGLFVLLNQLGYLLPAEEDSEIPIYDNVFADIGDKQDVLANLSTFSSHIKNISNILKKATKKSLVLIDELGTGTDPVEGAALGIGILKYLENKEISCVVTTHYSPIKIYGLKSSYFQTASVAFDEKTLKPLYKLIYNTIGESYAFHIAKRWGLPEEVLKYGREFLEKEEGLKNVKDLGKKLEKLIMEYESYKEKLKQLENDLKKKEEKLKEKEKLLKEEKIKELEDLIKELRQKRYLTKAEEKKYKEKLEKFEEKETVINYEFKIGDKVRDKLSLKSGTIIDINHKKKIATVSFGNIKMKVKFNQLEPIFGKTSQEIDKVSVVLNVKPPPFELKLLGKRVSEALIEIESYLDKASLAGLEKVKIVHGLGTGALKEAIWEYLKTSPYVKKFYSAPPHEGGNGATIVELR